jgi:protein-disulfide isomerase
MAKGDEEDKEEIEIKDFTKDFTRKARKNPWMAATIILGVALVVTLAFSLKGPLTSKVISQKSASDKIVQYVNTLADSEVNYVSSKDLGSFYEVKVSYQDQTMPLYISKDGKYWTSMLQLMQPSSPSVSQTSQPGQEIPKSDKPVIEAFVFSYCPYGLQFQKALMPVYKLLKNKADIRLVAIGAMHGEYEEKESIRQLCIEKEYGKDKLWDYLEKFMGKTEIGDCRGSESCYLPYIKTIFTQISIEEQKINTCMSSDGKALYNKDVARANELGVSGSPIFVINNVQKTVSRTPAAVLQAVCSAFNTMPSECNQTLSSEQASPWFGYSASSASSAASCG